MTYYKETDSEFDKRVGIVTATAMARKKARILDANGFSIFEPLTSEAKELLLKNGFKLKEISE